MYKGHGEWRRVNGERGWGDRCFGFSGLGLGVGMEESDICWKSILVVTPVGGIVSFDLRKAETRNVSHP